MSECIFCKIAKGEVESEKIYEGENFFIINDVNPVAEGHCLIISKKHYHTVFDMPDKLGEELLKLIKEQGKRLIDADLADGIKVVQNNFSASGQAVFHFHVHVIPELEGKKREESV